MKHPLDPWILREEVRRDLRTAIKSRQPETISVLRTIIAAIDNAEAIQPEAHMPRSADGTVAHSSPGVGSTEAPRRELAMRDVHAIIRDLLHEYDTQAQQYRSMRQHEAADRLRRQANILHSYLPASGSPTSC
ncbi:hypothetical protein MMAD_32370 [Mycolicibacterium madagascariense]|uniref:Uncharacterized protein n=1 Tax=Mycolicibacterium madagascariense TaxID=212765 RepID=A0A7I7XI76_9MYCO|nr:hypothetical protein MMAD_32370 [Mycolicibacterium madagascariense]